MSSPLAFFLLLILSGSKDHPTANEARNDHRFQKYRVTIPGIDLAIDFDEIDCRKQWNPHPSHQ
jgi:hypothetical protein